MDVRVAGPLPTPPDIVAACTAALDLDDTEAALQALGETRLALSFRIALATLDAFFASFRGAYCMNTVYIE